MAMMEVISSDAIFEGNLAHRFSAIFPEFIQNCGIFPRFSGTSGKKKWTVPPKEGWLACLQMPNRTCCNLP